MTPSANPDPSLLLLVDDQPANLHLLAEILRDDYAITTTTRGAEVLELASREPPPDLILLDVMMPDVNGLEVLRRLRAHPPTREIPVMMVSADATELTQYAGLEQGADDYVVKPIHPLVLRVRVRNLLRRKQAEEALRKSEARFRSDFELPLAGRAITPPSAGWIEVNATLCEMLGYSKAELVHMTWAELTHPDDLATDWAQFQRLLAGEIDGYTLEKRFIHKEGRSVVTELAVQCLRGPDHSVDYLVALIQDITQRKQYEAALRQSEAKFSAIFNLAPGPVAITRLKDGVVLEANPSFLEFFGYQADEVIGHSTLPSDLGLWVSNEERECWIRQLESDSPSIDQEVDLFHRDRSIRVVAISGRLIEIGGEKVILCNFHDVTEKKQFEEKIWRQANYDLLTGLPNRRLFEDRLAQELKKAQRERHPLALLFIDLDGFKAVNDTLGHDLGDVLLTEAAQRISRCVRETDTVARLGGDEFTVILPAIIDTARVIKVAEKMIQALDQPFDLSGETASISASVGIALYPQDGGDVENLLKSADRALYAVKDHGKRGYRFFNEPAPNGGRRFESTGTFITGSADEVLAPSTMLPHRQGVDRGRIIQTIGCAPHRRFAWSSDGMGTDDRPWRTAPKCPRMPVSTADPAGDRRLGLRKK